MIQIIIRQIAIIALINGVLDTGRILGVGNGAVNPFDAYSVTGFALLGGFAVARIFAAVGMWIESNWGAPLLLGITLVELVIYLVGSVRLEIGIVGFVARLIELVGAMLILWFAYKEWRNSIHD